MIVTNAFQIYMTTLQFALNLLIYWNLIKKAKKYFSFLALIPQYVLLLFSQRART